MVLNDYRFKIDPIQWHEGMPLAPQHFQLNDHRYQSILSFYALHSGPYRWGVSRMGIDLPALTKGIFRLQHISCVMPDGTLVNYEENSQLPQLEVPLSEVDAAYNDPFMIYLALPVYAPNEPSAAGNTPRYISTAGDVVVDENGSSGEPTRVPRLAPNLYLIVGQVPSSKFISFPIAEIIKEDGRYVQTSYIPPMLSLHRDLLLKRTLDELASALRAKIMYSLERFDASSDNPNQQHIRDILHTLIEGLLPFETLINAEGIPPFNLYMGLVELAARLSRLKVSVPEAPIFNTYQHTNIYGTFRVIIDYVQRIIDKMYDKVQTRTFQKQRGYFGLGLPAVWQSKTLMLGIKRHSTMSTSDAATWIENAIIGSQTYVQSIVDRRIVGTDRRMIEPDERTVISAPSDVMLIEVKVDPEFINLGEVLYVFNPSDTIATRPAEIFHYVTIDDI